MPRVDWRSEIDLLRSDNRSGAEEITLRAVELLNDLVGESIPGDAAAYRVWLLRLGRELLAAQPWMGILLRLVNDMLWACAPAKSGEQVRRAALEYLQNFPYVAAADLEGLAGHALTALAPYPTVMTYSRSSTVLRALSDLAARKRRVHVYCGEGRPMLEGQSLASELGWAGVDVTLGVDMALFGWLPEVKALVVGADSLSPEGLVNKLGTAELMRAALEHEVPRIVLCTTRKFLPQGAVLPGRLREGDPDEIMPSTNERVTVRNVYFDLTPLDLVSLVITEKGPLDQDALRHELARLRVYEGLRGG